MHILKPKKSKTSVDTFKKSERSLLSQDANLDRIESLFNARRLEDDDLVS